MDTGVDVVTFVAAYRAGGPAAAAGPLVLVAI